MSLRFFAIPACNPGAAEAELNGLLAASRVLSVERQLVLAGASHRAGELPVGLMLWHCALRDNAVLNSGLAAEQALRAVTTA